MCEKIETVLIDRDGMSAAGAFTNYNINFLGGFAMYAYIFQADLYCGDCASELTLNLQKPDGFDDDLYDSDDYPKGPFADGGGESDSPAHCGGCGVFLKNPLTVDGVAYVKEAAENNGSTLTVKLWLDYYDYIELD